MWPGITYSTCEAFSKSKERTRFLKSGDSRYIYQKELDEP